MIFDFLIFCQTGKKPTPSSVKSTKKISSAARSKKTTRSQQFSSADVMRLVNEFTISKNETLQAKNQVIQILQSGCRAALNE